MKNKFIKTSKVVYTMSSIVVALLLSAFFLLALGYNPIDVFVTLFEGSLGSSYSIMKSLANATPLIFTGLSFFFADKAGLFNIGAEGQFLVGGITAGVVGYSFSQIGFPPILSLFFSLSFSFLAGSFWGFIPGVLKSYYGANEFIVSMMMNYVAEFLCGYLVTYPFRGPGVTAKTNDIPEQYQLHRFVESSQLNLGFIIGIAIIILVYLFFRYLPRGMEIKIMGKNRDAAVSNGVLIKKETIFVFLIAGGIAALGGAIEVLGVHGFYINDISSGYGFDGIAVAILSQGNTAGILFSSILFGMLKAGGSRLDLRSVVPSEFIIVFEAIIIVFIATPRFMDIVKNKAMKKQKGGN